MTLTLRAMPVALLTASCGLVTDFTPEPDALTGTTASATSSTSSSASTSVASSSASAGGSPGSGGAATSSSEASGGSGGQGEGGGTGGDGGGNGGAAEGGAGGGGGAPPLTEGAVSLFRSGTPGGLVEVRSLAIDADGTAWIGGWFTGDALKHGAPGEVDVTVVSGQAGRTTTFVAGVDALGQVVHSFAITRSLIDDGGDSLVGVRLQVADDGSIFLVSSLRQGSIRLADVAAPSVGQSNTRLVVARVTPSGVNADATAEWAAVCRGTAELPDGVTTQTSPADLDARRSSIAMVGEDRLALATSFSAVDTIRCTSVVAAAETDPCDDFEVTPNGGVVVHFFREDGGCAAEPVPVHAGAGVLTVDDVVALGDESVLVTGQVFAADEIQPWGDGIDEETAHAFAGELTLAGDPVGPVVALPSLGFGVFAASDGTFVSVSPTLPPEEPEGTGGGGGGPELTLAGDVHVEPGDGEPLVLGDADDSTSTEVATGVDVEGGGLLLTGFLTEEATLADDLCRDVCSGDLVDADVCAATPAFSDTDAYWLYLPRGGAAPDEAIGRSFGGCGRQKLVAGALTPEAILLVAQLDGSATLDLLDAQLTVEADPTRRVVALVRIVRPEDR